MGQRYGPKKFKFPEKKINNITIIEKKKSPLTPPYK